MPGGPPDATPSPAYLGTLPRPEPTTTLFTLCYNATLRKYFTNLHKGGWGGPPSPLAQRASTSESHTCTSMASSGSPSSSGVKHTGEQSESNHGLLKSRGCSSSIMATHSHNRHRGLISSLVLPCPCVMSLDGSSGFASPHPYISLCSSHSGLSPSSLTFSSCVCLSSSSEEESSVHPRRWWVLSSMMRSTSWGACGTKFANVTTVLSSTHLRSLATLWVGTHSTSSLVGLYARMLPSKMRACTMHK